MKNKTIRAIILKSKDFGEADRLLTLYSVEAGKTKAKAKSARKINSKLGGYLDAISLARIDLVIGKSIDTVVGVTSEKHYEKIKKSITKTSLSIFFCEMIDKLFFEDDVNAEIFFILKDALDILEDIVDTSDFLLLKAVFEYKVLESLGHKPKIDSCVVCKSKDCSRMVFDYHLGGVLCNNCIDQEKNSCNVTEKTLKILNAFSKLHINDIMKLKDVSADMAEVSDILKNFNNYTYDKHFKSESFWKKSLKLI